MKKILLTAISIALLNFCSKAQTAPFTFVHISDLHVSTVTSSVNTCDLNGAEAQCYLSEFAQLSPKPAYILATGDISNIGNSSAVSGGMYTALTQYLYPSNLTNPGVGALHIDQAQTIPIYFAPGNHDYYTTLLPPGTLTQLNTLPNYARYIAPDSDYAVVTPISVTLFVRSGWDISYLISLDPKASGLTDAQCNWIRSELAANSTKRKIIVMHHPAANYTGTNCDASAHSAIADSATATMYVNRTTFLNICDSNHVDVVLAGHSHQNVVVDRAGMQVADNCTTCGTRFVQTGPAFAGCYRVITVDSSFVSVGAAQRACAATAIQDIENEIEFKLYPDPSAGLFTLSFGQPLAVAVKVFNMLGACVYQKQATGPKMDLDMRDQPEGMYIVQVTFEGDQPATYILKSPVVISRR